MQDTAFASLLQQNAALDRCIADIGFEGGVAAPQYERYAAEIAAKIMPARDSRYQSILGEQTQVSHYGFVGVPTPAGSGSDCDIQVGDLLVWKVSEAYLTEDVQAGATEVPISDAALFEAGQLVEIGAGATSEQATVAEGGYPLQGSGCDALILTTELQHDHAEQEAAVLVRRFQVLYVRSWPGIDHHLELALNEITI